MAGEGLYSRSPSEPQDAAGLGPRRPRRPPAEEGRVMSTALRAGGSIIEQLAAYTMAEAFDKLPAATVQAARLAILDTLGVTLAGSLETTAERVRTLIGHRRGVDEATIIGTALRACV